MMYLVGETDAGSVAVGQAHRNVSLSSRLPARCTQTGPGERPSPFNSCPMPSKTPTCRRQVALSFPRGTCPIQAEPVQGRASRGADRWPE
jgi:hypothetical protein